MRGQEGRIEQTLLEPDIVVRSNSDDSIRLFYRHYRRLIIGDKNLCVVVKYTQETAFIITAYFTDKVKKGDILWPK